MGGNAHLLGRLDVEAAVPDLDTAMALRPRIEALCGRLVPRVLERVFDAMAPEDLHVQIDRLDLDLGTVRPDHLEEDVLAALETAVSEALSRLIPAARRNGSDGARALTPPAARLKRFETYLLTGVVPLRDGAEPFDARARLLELADEQPDALIAMLRLRARDGCVLERLVLQLGDEGLARLLAILAPADAAVILGLLVDVMTVHRTQRPPELDRIGASTLHQRVWVASLEFLLRDVGSQFNRRRFLRFLLEREARRAGVAYPAFLQLMAAAAHRAQQRSPLRSSLPRTLAELLNEFQTAELAWRGRAASAATVAATVAAAVADAEVRRRIERFLAAGHPRGGAAALAAMAAREPEWLAERIRQAARAAPHGLPALARRLLDWLLPREVLGLLAPEQAALLSGAVSEAPGGERAALVSMIVALLRGEEPAAPPPARGCGPRLDRRALLDHWLVHGEVAEWAPPGVSAADLLADLPRLNVAELTTLFLADDADGCRERLARAVAALGPDRAAPLIARIGSARIGSARIGSARIGSWLARGGEDARRPLSGALRRLTALAGPATGPEPRRAGAAAVDRDRLFAWLDGTGNDHGDAAELARQFVALADQDDPALRDHLAANRMRPAARARWAAILPHEALGRLVERLVPSGSRELIDGVMLIGAAWRYTAPFGAPRPEPRLLWSSLLERIAAPRPVDLAQVLDGLMETLTRGDAAQRTKLTARARRLAHEGGYVSIRTALRRTHPPPPRLQTAQSRPERFPVSSEAPLPLRGDAEGRRGLGKGGIAAGKRNKTLFRLRRNHPLPTLSPARGERLKKDRPMAPTQSRPAPDPDHPIYIGNAGLVLFNPYLPLFFERLGLLPAAGDPSARRTGIEPASRAAHLLQYLADGRLGAPEPELALNKLLCGHPCAWPIAPSHDAERAELELCDGLLQAMIANWPALRNTSPDGLRETFLQREGRLRHADGKWLLQVQRRTLDVLTDQIPWSFGVVFHPWMPEPIHVTW